MCQFCRYLFSGLAIAAVMTYIIGQLGRQHHPVVSQMGNERISLLCRARLFSALIAVRCTLNLIYHKFITVLLEVQPLRFLSHQAIIYKDSMLGYISLPETGSHQHFHCYQTTYKSPNLLEAKHLGLEIILKKSTGQFNQVSKIIK